MLKNERGSITVFTLTAVLFFVIILMGIFISANNSKRAQKSADTTIIDRYSKEVNLVNEIYNEKKLQSSKIGNAQGIEIKWNTNDITYVTNTTANINAQIIIDESIDVNFENCKFIINNDKNPITKQEDWNSQNAIAITNYSGTIQTSIDAGKTYYIHVLIIKNDGTKVQTISNALKINENIDSNGINSANELDDNANSTYSYEIVSKESVENYDLYNVNLYIKNNDQDYNAWMVEFTLPEEIAQDSILSEQAKKIDIQNNIITMYCNDSNAELLKNDILQIRLQIKLSKNINFNIENVKLNEKTVVEQNS